MTARTRSERGAITILVVDDDASANDLIRVNLEADGFRVCTAHDGLAALAEAATGKIDAVITDMVMPRLDGWALCEQLRNRPETARLPIIGLTIASSDRTTMLLADAIVTKPFDYPTLRAVLDRVLAARTHQEDMQ